MRPKSPKPQVEIKVTRLTLAGVEEFRVWASARGGAGSLAQSAAVYRAVAGSVESPESLRIVGERVFGRLRDKPQVLGARSAELVAAGIDPSGPVTYLECAPVSGASPAGIEMTLVRESKGVRILPIREARGIAGFKVSKGLVARAYLSTMHGVGRSSPGTAEAQAKRMFARALKALRSAGMGYANVACTRIYVRRLLDWYNSFNAVRTPFYRRAGIIGRKGFSIPTSTGIQGKLSDECECVMDVFAVSKGPLRRSPFNRLRNPLQNEATAYGSAFARGARVDFRGGALVYLAGTASIDETGQSVHVGDPVMQARRAVENFEAIAKAGGARIADLCEAVWYCKSASYERVLRREMKRAGWPDLPWIFVKGDVCRHDLLVEIDGAAAVSS